MVSKFVNTSKTKLSVINQKTSQMLAVNQAYWPVSPPRCWISRHNFQKVGSNVQNHVNLEDNYLPMGKIWQVCQWSVS